MASTGIELIDKYSKYFKHTLLKKGFKFDTEDLMSELYEVYARCVNGFEADENISFNTYAIKAFKYRIKEIEMELQKERSNTLPMTDAEGNVIDIKFFGETGYDRILMRQLKREIFMKINSGRGIIIFNEMINTSEKVLNVMDLIAMHNCQTHPAEQKVKGNGIFRKAIELVYGFSAASVLYNVKRIKKIARMTLTY